MHGLAPNTLWDGRMAGLGSAHRRLFAVIRFALILALAGIIGGCAANINGTAVAVKDSPKPTLSKPKPTLSQPTLSQPKPSNPTSGLSYRIPGEWQTKSNVGALAGLQLSQGALLNPYTCGTPPERLTRGLIGSASVPSEDPAVVATALARLAAGTYYATRTAPPQVQVEPARQVSRPTPSGATVPGVVVTAIASQSGDPCFATKGEVQVLVLRFADHDGVLVADADLAGGPTNPGPGTEDELTAIIDSAQPTGG